MNKPNIKQSIYVTQPSLATLDDFMKHLKIPFESGVLTHNGPLVQKLEKELCAMEGVRNLLSVVNGTIALQMPIKAFKMRGEIITTPFSWIATCSSIIWEGCTPVFADIYPKSFNIDPNKIEDSITHRTVGIMPVHVFSNPCDTDSIQSIAEKYNIKVIYDAAHAMFTKHKGKSLLEFGDVAATSFHATKLFNTGEGGACVTNNDELHEQLKRIRFFGHDDNKNVIEDGFNGKMTEIHAALGLANLKHVDHVTARRKEIFEQYHVQLSELDFIDFQSFNKDSYNYSYMPVVLKSENLLEKVLEVLNANSIYPRRYFYPSLNTIRTISPYTSMQHSEDIAKRIICLPSYTNLSNDEIENICSLIKSAY